MFDPRLRYRYASGAAMTAHEPHAVPVPYLCAHCAEPLPIVPSMAPGAKRLVCTFCGSWYRGYMWTDIPEKLKGNIRIDPD